MHNEAGKQPLVQTDRQTDRQTDEEEEEEEEEVKQLKRQTDGFCKAASR